LFYNGLIKKGVPAEDARFVLPNAATTTIVVSGNFRAWREMLILRLSTHAQWEIREMANKILDQLIEIAPTCFEDLKK
jgi:thymidylate synthase (FAD)